MSRLPVRHRLRPSFPELSVMNLQSPEHYSMLRTRSWR